MKIIVSSDRERVVIAENVDLFEVIPFCSTVPGKKDYYSVCADSGELSRHGKRDRAITELNKLAVTLSTDNNNLLYYMEDTN